MRSIFVLAASLCLSASSFADESLNWRVFGHPTAEKKPPARKINELKLFDGRLYIGHGDYGVNTGPTAVLYYDFEQEKFVDEFTVQEEAIVDYRVLDGRLVIPGVDSTESWAKGNFYVLGKGGWIKYRTVPYGVHVFDAVSWRDRWYVATGNSVLQGKGQQQLSLGAVLSTGDQGESWQWEYTTPTERNAVYRVKGVVPYKNHLYAFVYGYRVFIVNRMQEKHRRDLINLQGTADDHVLGFVQDVLGSSDAMQFNGVVWRSVDLFPGENVTYRKPFVFKDSLCAVTTAGEFVASSSHYDLAKRGWPDYISHKICRYRDGKATEVQLEFTTVEDVLVRDDTLYLLIQHRGQYRIAVTTNFEKWTFYNIPGEFGDAISIEVAPAAIYVGLRDGRILVADRNSAKEERPTE